MGLFDHKQKVLNANLDNWKSFSSSLKRTREVKAVDDAIARYRTNHNDQVTRILLASAIFRWYESNPNTCPHDILVPLLNQISLDIGDSGQRDFGSRFGITIPTMMYRRFKIVVTSSSECTNFPMLVEGALAQISSRRLGNALLRGMEAGNKYVCIKRSSARTWGNWSNGIVGFQTGSVCKRFNENDACSSGIGCNSSVDWQPDAISTPDGDRPAFIALAHELIHAYHNSLGVAFANAKDEEASTVGLMRFWLPANEMDNIRWAYPFFDTELHTGLGGAQKTNMFRVPSLHITENMIRHEHRIPPRIRYCDMILPEETNRI